MACRPIVLASICIALWALGGARPSWAHEAGLSRLFIEARSDRIVLDWAFARSDLEILVGTGPGGGRRSPPSLTDLLTHLERRAADGLLVQLDGRPITVETVRVEADADDGVHLLMEFPAGDWRTFSARSRLLSHLGRGHRQYVSVRDSAGHLLVDKILDAGRSVVSVDRSGTPIGPFRHRSFASFLILGIEHILTGYDHLLFLFAILLVAGSAGVAARIITSFTVAHSITLVLATFDVIVLRAGLVEPLIAFSIAYVGLENLFRRNLDRRPTLTFAFGLVHGLGFAFQLKELGVGAGAFVPLVSFNLGVEVGQIAIALITFPILWKLRERPCFPARILPVSSAVIAAVGGYWFVVRLLPV